MAVSDMGTQTRERVCVGACSRCNPDDHPVRRRWPAWRCEACTPTVNRPGQRPSLSPRRRLPGPPTRMPPRIPLLPLELLPTASRSSIHRHAHGSTRCNIGRAQPAHFQRRRLHHASPNLPHTHCCTPAPEPSHSNLAWQPSVRFPLRPLEAFTSRPHRPTVRPQSRVSSVHRHAR